VEEREQRARVGHLRLAVVRLAQDDHVVVRADAQAVEHRPAGRVAQSTSARRFRSPAISPASTTTRGSGDTAMTSEPGATYSSSSRMMAGPWRFQPRRSVLSAAASRTTAVTMASRSDGRRPRSDPRGAVVLGQHDRRSPGRMGSDGGGQSCARPSRTIPAAMPPVTSDTGVPERRARQLGQIGDVELVAGEVQELKVDRRQAGLAAGLGDDPGDEVVGHEQVDLVPRDEPGDGGAGFVADLGHDPVRLPRAGPAGR